MNEAPKIALTMCVSAAFGSWAFVGTIVGLSRGWVAIFGQDDTVARLLPFPIIMTGLAAGVAVAVIIGSFIWNRIK